MANSKSFMGSPVVQKPSTSAVPVAMPKTAIEKEYDQYKMCFELDVIVTIEKDLEEEAM